MAGNSYLSLSVQHKLSFKGLLQVKTFSTQYNPNDLLGGETCMNDVWCGWFYGLIQVTIVLC